MPSDGRAAAALNALAAPRDRFRSALATTVESVRAQLDEHRTRTEGRLDHLTAEFGKVGAANLDIERLAAIINSGPTVDPATLTVVERAYDSLKALAERPDAGLSATVPSGGSLSATVAAALADTGRAIGAARMVALAREGRYRPAEHDQFMESLPFGQWSIDERRLAPPLVVSLAGADLRPSALAEYLDGDMKFVLVVADPATPAPLVRLITPRTFVAQTTEVDAVERLAAWEGPGVVAVMPEGTAEFVHDPSKGEHLAGRLSVTSQPDGSGLRRIGPHTVAQQRDELQQLSSLAAARASTGDSAEAGAEDPVGKLAAWLLTQADDSAGGRNGRQGE